MAAAPTRPAVGRGITRTTVEVMGTVVSIAVAHHRSPGARPADGADGTDGTGRHRLTAALAGAEAALRSADEVFSTYRPLSQISRLRRGELAVEDAGPDVAEVLVLCASAAAATDGAFDPEWDGRLDPTGLVKGWAAQRASAALRAAGFADHAVGAGGDVVCAGEASPGAAWRVGVADPHRPDAVLHVVELRDAAIATSGTAERGAHVVDPTTGAPAHGLVSASAVGPDLATADALATAAIAGGRAGAPWMRRLVGYGLLTVDDVGARWATPGLADAV